MSKEDDRRESRRVRTYVRGMRKDMDKQLEDIEKRLSTLRGKADEAVIKRPVLALSVAFLIGMAIGVILSKSND